MEEKEKILQESFTVYLNRRISVVEKLKIIKYAEERNIQAASNY